jgi:hypothetical protein
MKSFLLSLVLFWQTAHAATDRVGLVPGLSYFPGSERIGGKVVFLCSTNTHMSRNDTNAAMIYQFKLDSEKLTKVGGCPNGLPYFALDGGSVCVDYRPVPDSDEGTSHFFVYSVAGGKQRALVLPGKLDQLVIDGGHVVVALRLSWGVDVLDYAIDRDEVRLIQKRGDPLWPRVEWTGTTLDSNGTNLAELYQERFGNTEGLLRLIAEAHERNETFRDYNGQYIFFDGDYGPEMGHRLMRSSERWRGDLRSDQDRASMGGQKVLATFGRKPNAGRNSTFQLLQISPNRRYALVRESESILRRNRRGSDDVFPTATWTKNTYHIVDLSTGASRAMFLDETDKDDICSISTVHWVQ